jgi:WD40 repeat protein
MILKVPTGEVVARVPTTIRAELLQQLAISPDGAHLALVGDGRLELREVPTLRIEKEARYDGLPSCLMAVSKGGQFVAVGRSRIEVWETAAGRVYVLDELNHHLEQWLRDGPTLTDSYAKLQYCLSALTFVDDSSRLCAITHDGIFVIWDVATGKCVERKQIAKVVHLK